MLTGTKIRYMFILIYIRIITMMREALKLAFVYSLKSYVKKIPVALIEKKTFPWYTSVRKRERGGI